MFLDTLVRYGQLYQREQQEASTSLFGGQDAIEITTPPIPAAEEWSTIERLNRERDLVGIYISAHPLDEYSVILNSMCNTQCAELKDKRELLKKENVVLGGFVTAVKSKMTKNNKPCGFVTIEDFNGSGELALFGEEWGKWNGMLTQGTVVFITAKCTQKYPNSDFIDITISNIDYMQTVKEKCIEKITITVDSDIIDETLNNDLCTIIERSPKDSRTQLYVQIHNVETNDFIMLRATDRGVNVDKELVQFIESNPKMSYHIN